MSSWVPSRLYSITAMDSAVTNVLPSTLGMQLSWRGARSSAFQPQRHINEPWWLLTCEAEARRSEVHGSPQLHIKFGASLGYMRSSIFLSHIINYYIETLCNNNNSNYHYKPSPSVAPRVMSPATLDICNMVIHVGASLGHPGKWD